MSDEDQGGAVFAIKREQQIGNFVPGLAIEVAGGLIGEQNGRTPIEGPGQRHPLLFAAGELRRQVVQAFAKPQLLKQRPGIARLWLSLAPRSSAGSSTFSGALSVGISIND